MGFRDPITDVATGTDISNVETLVNGVKAKTDNLPAAPANEAGKVATVDSRVAGPAALEATAQSIKTKTDALGVTTGLPGYRVKSTGKYQTLLQAALGITCGVSYAWGSWTQYAASLASEAAYILGVQASAGNSAAAFFLDIGTGAGGSEVSRAQLPVPWQETSAGYRPSFWLPIPILVPASTRVAVRGTSGYGTGQTLNVMSLVWINASDLEVF